MRAIEEITMEVIVKNLVEVYGVADVLLATQRALEANYSRLSAYDAHEAKRSFDVALAIDKLIRDMWGDL